MVKRVLEWSVKAFKLSPTDAADKILVLKSNASEELPFDAHIGSFAQPLNHLPAHRQLRSLAKKALKR